MGGSVADESGVVDSGLLEIGEDDDDEDGDGDEFLRAPSFLLPLPLEFCCCLWMRAARLSWSSDAASEVEAGAAGVGVVVA